MRNSKAKRKSLRTLDIDIGIMMGWRWYIETRGGENKLYLLPEKDLYTEETGGWVRHNGEQIPGIHRRTSRLATKEEIEKIHKFPDWDMSASYFTPYSRNIRAKFIRLPEFSTNYNAMGFLVDWMTKKQINFDIRVNTYHKKPRGIFYEIPIIPITKFVASSAGHIRSGQSIQEAVARIALTTGEADSLKMAEEKSGEEDEKETQGWQTLSSDPLGEYSS